MERRGALRPAPWNRSSHRSKEGPSMKHLLRPLTLIALAAMAPYICAQSAPARYPDRNVRILVGYSAGTTSDVFARIIAQKLGERWGQPVIVENRDGAAGS